MIIKQNIGSHIYIGGKPEEIEPLNFSCFNFNGNLKELEIIKLSDVFWYFVISEKDYVRGRSRNIHFNWNYNNPDGTTGQRYRRTRMARKLSILKAQKELGSFKEEHFISNKQLFHSPVYHFGNIPPDLAESNSVYSGLESKQERITVKTKLIKDLSQLILDS